MNGYRIVTMAINTGMRQGEIFNLTWFDVDLSYSPKSCLNNRKTRARPPEPIPRRLQRSASFAFGDAFLSKNSWKNFSAGLLVFRFMLSRPRFMPSMASILSCASIRLKLLIGRL